VQEKCLKLVEETLLQPMAASLQQLKRKGAANDAATFEADSVWALIEAADEEMCR
jgi:hypothetical protein